LKLSNSLVVVINNNVSDLVDIDIDKNYFFPPHTGRNKCKWEFSRAFVIIEETILSKNKLQDLAKPKRALLFAVQELQNLLMPLGSKSGVS